MVTTETTEAMTDGNASFLRAARSGNVEKILEHLKGNIDINTSNANGLNALHLASKEGNVNVVTELLKRGANVNAATKKGNTALHIASLAGQEEVVRVLVQAGANVNSQSQNGFTPLYMAAQENHDSVVSFLLANGANQSLATEDGFTPLAVALQQGHDKVVAVLLENDTKGRVRLPALHIAAKKDDCKAATLLLQSDHNPDVTSKSGFTPLHIAAHYGNENIAKILLTKGADVNYAAKHQITPLHVASKWGKMNMVVLLLENGANIEASTRDGLTPLHCAARSGHDQVVDLLLEKGAPFLAKTKNGLAPLHMASQGDHVDSARILLYHKAPVDDVTVDYLTALHVAAHCGHVKVAKLLLDRKADPNARALNGFTPLHIACKKNRIKVVELLLKHGASIEATTESGLTPLHVASFMGCMNIVIYLIQNGANPDVPTVRGETPLHLAARANQTDIIRILLRNGASVDARAREEQTPLHIAARLGNVDIVSLLLQHGAAVDATTKDMYTALHIASKEDQEEVAACLLDHGASLTSTTKKGFTPLHLAAKYGNIKVARLLIQKEAPVDAQGKNGVTPLHVAAHYDHVNVALLLLDKGASPHASAKNGYTPLHIAAKKNQMDIASTLLEYGAKTNSESKAGFTPLHLASQEGHADMASLLIENKADVNHKANNGLTPLHLCAQDDRVNVAHILVSHKAEIDPQTKAGYTPLHVASHFGQVNMVRFLLQNRANVQNTTSHGYTPLHQAAQQGHTLVVNLLLENEASPNVTTTQGQTPLSIAQRLGYISVVETLKVVTETTITTTTTTVTEEKYKVVAPETMQETFMTDSEDEGGEEAMLGDQSYGYLTADEMKSLGDDSLPIDVTKDEKHHDIMHSVKQFGAPMVEEDKLSPQHMTPVESGFSEKFSPDNIDLARAPVHAGRFSWADDFYYSSLPKGMLRSRFLVSFMVDARGGAMRGCRHSGVRIIIPPRKASMPMRITCRYLRKEKLIHPPPLMEGEACASRILEMGPVGARFLGPVIIEVPHFASTRGKEREITILRSDTGESWREHVLEASEEAVQDVLNESFEGEELSALEDLNTNRITRILTTDFPQYFAIITRIRQEVHGVGPEGGMVSSTVVPQVQAIFPEGALTKKIRVGLQAQPIAPELVAKLLGNRVAVSPIVTVEPRRRKFHKPITLTIPVPQAATKGMINQYSGDAPTLRLLCSITGGSSKAQWEDVTGSTPLTFVNDCVSFTTTVSARFWLMDCRQVNEVTRFATDLYQEAVYVPFMSKFVIFAKRYDPYEAQLRVFCMTDDKEDKTLECQEHFTEIAKSRDVEVLEGKLQYLEFAGNIAPVTKSGEQLQFPFQAFHENRLPFCVRVKDPHMEPMGRIAFMREPKAARGEPPQVPICNLNVALPEITLTDSSDVIELVTLEKRYDFIQEAGLSKPELIHRADLRLSDIAQGLDKDWVLLAQQLDVSESDIAQIKADTTCEPSEQALMMLRLWLQKSGSKATGNELEKGLRKVNREDIIKNCMFNVELVTDDVEKAVAKVHLDQSGFDVFKEELGSSRDASIRRGASLDISYDEQDIMKEAESAAETSSETGSLFERDQISQALTDDKDDCNADDDVAALFPKCKMPSNHQNEESLNNNINAQEITAPFAISEGDDNILKNKMATNNIEPETQTYAKQHEFWPSVPVTTSNVIVPSDSINIEQNTNNKEIGLTPNISKEETLNISNLIMSEHEIKTPLIDKIADNYKSNDTSDFGYCSMDKVTCTSPTSISDSENLTNTSKNNSEQSGPESPLAISPELNLERTPDEKLSIEQTSEMRLLEGENTFQKQPASENDCLKNQMLLLHTSSSVVPAAAESTVPLAIGSESNVICEHSVETETTFQSGDPKFQDSTSTDARIRRASKTPPPSPVDRNGGDDHADKVKEILLTQAAFDNKFKEEYFKGPAEVEQKLAEISGHPEIPARLTESETWPSLELDTSQVSISSLPEDEKTEPTTATVSDAVALAADTDDNGESNDEKDPPQAIQPSTPTAISSPDRQPDDEVEIKETVVKLHPEGTGKVTEITTVTRTVLSEIDSKDLIEDSPLQKFLQDGATVTTSQEVVTVVSSSEPVSADDGKTVETSAIEHAQREKTMLAEDPELISDGTHTRSVEGQSSVPCAFVNTAFAGADLIDKVEQSSPARSRSPYEVVRGEEEDDIPVRTTYVSEIRRRPMLQNIPSEISEEDLVERDIGYPELRLEALGITRFSGATSSLTEQDSLPATESSTERTVTSETVTYDTEAGGVTKTTVVTRVCTTTTALVHGRPDEKELDEADKLATTTDATDSSKKIETVERSQDSVAASEQMVSSREQQRVSSATEAIDSSAVVEGAGVEQITNGPGEVEYRPDYDYSDEYSSTKWSAEQFGDAANLRSSYGDPSQADDVRKSRYSSVSDDVIDYEIGEILKSDQQFDDIIERPMTPEPPVDEYLDAGITNSSLKAKRAVTSELKLSDYELKDKDDSLYDEAEPISSPALSPDDSRSGFAYGMQFEKDVLDAADEAMDVDSDPYSEEKDPIYGYGMRYEREAVLEEEEVPCYGDLYTHEEEDEDALENGDKVKPVVKPKKEPDYDMLAGRKYFSKNVEIDELSVSSLQEFEHLEAEIVSGRKSSVGSLDSLNDKPSNGKSGDHDDVSMSSLTEFERLERECLEVEKIDPAMQESITQLSEIEEGHESQASETSQEHKSDGCKDEDLSIIEEYDNPLGDIDNIILHVESKSKDELPFQYVLKQVPKPSDVVKSEVPKDGDNSSEVIKTTDHASITFTSETCMQHSRDHLTKSNGKSDDIDQDSLRDEISLKPDSLADDPRHEYLDSLHDGKCDEDDSLQGDIPDVMRDSLLEERHLEDDSLHEMDILPDESSLSMESSFAAAISHDSSRAEDQSKGKRQDGQTIFSSLEGCPAASSKVDKVEIVVSELPKCDIMLSSTDSLEQSSSAAAAFHFESESAMSTSLTGALASEDNTMISSTDTLEHEGRITFRYEDIPIDELEILVKDGRQVIVDSEGNIQTDYDMKHFLDSGDNLNDFNLCSKNLTEIKLPSTSTVHVQSALTSISYTGDSDDTKTKFQHSAPDESEKQSRFESSYSDPDVEVEEIHTTDEFGNPKTIKRIKKVLTTRTQFSSSSSSENVEEKLKEFLREHAAGERAGLGEEVVQEERSIDDKGNVLLVRTVQQQVLTEPEVHSQTFTGPDAAALSEEYVRRFKDVDPTEDVCEYEKMDDQGNVVRVTQQVVIKPEVHSVSFSGPNAREQMEEYMRQFTAASQNGDTSESQSFSTVKISTTTEQSQGTFPSERISHDSKGGNGFIQTTSTTVTPESSEKIVRTVTTTCTTVSSADDHAHPGGSSDEHAPPS